MPLANAAAAAFRSGISELPLCRTLAVSFPSADSGSCFPGCPGSATGIGIPTCAGANRFSYHPTSRCAFMIGSSLPPQLSITNQFL